MKRMIAVALFGASMAQAQEAYVDRNTVLRCFANTPVGSIFPQCLGAASNQCQTAPGGSSTIGIVNCIVAETRIWDEILNAQYKQTQSANAAADTRGQGAGINRVEALRDAQRAWIAFRDADCSARYAMWQDGTIRGVVGANCQMTETASRALALRDMRGN